MKNFIQTARAGAVVAGLAMLLAGCGQKTAQAPQTNVLARVGDQVITVTDFEAELQYRNANHQPVLERRELLNAMIERATLVQRAKNAGLDHSGDVRRTFDDVLIAKLKENDLDPKLATAKISPEEIKTAYERDIARLTQPAKAQLAFVYLKADSKWVPERVAAVAARASDARRLATALPAGEKGFGQVAADFSDDQISRYRGGDGGWFTADAVESRWPREIVAAGINLKNPGDISEVISAPEGFYLVKKMDARAAVVIPLDQARSVIERRLLTVKREQIENEFRHAAGGVTVTNDLQLLSRVDYPNPSTVRVAAAPPGLPANP